MASAARVVLIFGSGPNVGVATARAFAAKGYKVAATSRQPQEQGKDGIDLHIQADLVDSTSVAPVFKKVTEALGSPSVVIYNAASAKFSPPEDPLNVSVEDFTRDLQVNTISAYTAAREAVAGFETLPATAARTFIYTGNILNITPLPAFVSLGAGKSATAHVIAQSSAAYAAKGHRFYYADERTAAGAPVARDINGAAHGEFYSELAEGGKDIPWLATFVAGKGYVNFSK